MEGIVVIALIALIFIISKDLICLVYGIGILEIFFRLCTFLYNQVGGHFLGTICKYVPSSMVTLIDKYTNGTLFTILLWTFISIMIVFLVLNIKVFAKKMR